MEKKISPTTLLKWQAGFYSESNFLQHVFTFFCFLYDSSKLDKSQISTKGEELQTGYLHLSSGILWVHINQAVDIFPHM